MLPFQRQVLGSRSQRSFLCRFVFIGLIAGLSALADAGLARAEFIGSSAATVVTPAEGGGFEYRYTITNTSTEGGPSLLTWGMPFFDNAAASFVNGEASIFAPAGWTWIFTELTPSTSNDLWGYVAADDPKNDTYGAPGSAFDNPPYALVFLVDIFNGNTTGILPGGSLGDFGYVSPYSGVNVPFIAGFNNLQLTIGDPIGPQTPTFPVATQDVPEPTSMVMLVTGGLVVISAMGFRRLKRRTASVTERSPSAV